MVCGAEGLDGDTEVGGAGVVDRAKKSIEKSEARLERVSSVLSPMLLATRGRFASDH